MKLYNINKAIIDCRYYFENRFITYKVNKNADVSWFNFIGKSGTMQSEYRKTITIIGDKPKELNWFQRIFKL